MMLPLKFRTLMHLFLAVCAATSVCRAQEQATPVQLQLFRTLMTPTPINSLAISPDGKQVAASCYDEIDVWTMEGKTVATLKAGALELPGATTGTAAKETLEQASSPVVALAFSTDGSRLAGMTVAAGVGIWSLPDGKLLYTLAPHPKGTLCVAWSPDGKTIVTGGADHVIELWDATTGQMKTKLDEHFFPIRALAFDEDGILVSVAVRPQLGFENTEIKHWSLDSHAVVGACLADNVDPASVVLSPKGQVLTSEGYGKRDKHPRRQYTQEFTVWNTNSGVVALTSEYNGGLSRLIFSPDDALVLAVAKFRVYPNGLPEYAVGIQAWQISTGDIVAQVEDPKAPFVRTAHDPVGASPSAILFGAMSSQNQIALAYKSSITLWQAP